MDDNRCTRKQRIDGTDNYTSLIPTLDLVERAKTILGHYLLSTAIATAASLDGIEITRSASGIRVVQAC